MEHVVICDLGIGNLRSVARALERSGATVRVESEARALADAAALVVPGQGAFRDGAHALARGMGDAIREHVRRGRPYLGICLGLQLLFDESDEAPGEKGLSVLAGRVTRIPARGLKVPHIGWNLVMPARAEVSDATTPLRTDQGDANDPLRAVYGRQVYFAHSFAAEPADRAVVRATVDYGESLACAVAKDNVMACQFHPEKSQGVGLAFLGAWLSSVR